MAARTLKIKFDGDATGLAQATSGASATLERFNKSTEQTRRGMDRVGDSSENLADSSSLATGALGALSSGFELVGLEGYSQRLQQAALATDFMSGVGDSLTLVTKKLGLAKLKASVATVRQTVTTKAATAATKAATIAQRALNLVLRANPIGLVITAVAGLIAVLVLAYKRSETFRRIVDRAFEVVQRAARAVWDWIRRNFPRLFDIITRPFRLALSVVNRVWDGLVRGAGNARDWVVRKFNGLVDWFRRMPGRISGIAGRMWDGLAGSFRGVLNSIIGWWNGFSLSVNIPDAIPGLPGSFTINTPNVGYLAAGGYAAPGRTYVVGENGPELLTMGGRGFVTPNGQLGSAGIGDSDLRQLAGRLLELLAELMGGAITESHRNIKRRAVAGTGVAR